ISTVFNQGVSLDDSLRQLCELIVGYGDFSFCEIWLPTFHQKTLRLSARVDTDTAAKKFHKHSKNMEEMAFNVGLPGKVWSGRQSIVLEDIDVNDFFLRNKAAQKAGIKTVLGTPLTHQENGVGVLVVGS